MSKEFELTQEQEDALLERLLEELEQDGEGFAQDGEGFADEASQRVYREYLETLGLLVYENEPVTPSPELEKRLLAALKDEGRVGSAPSAPGSVADFATRRQARQQTAGGSSWGRWALPLAASLALLLLGLTGWQSVQLEEQRQIIDRLSSQLDETRVRTGQLAQYRDQVANFESRLTLVTSPGVEVCTLKPVAKDVAPESWGVLFVAADHQHWYLKIDGLVPCPRGRAYQLWFVTEGGQSVSAGTFDPQLGVRVELSSETMPAGTKAVSITLEPAGGSETPSGPAVLYGDQVMRIL